MTLTCTANDSIPSPSSYQFYHNSNLVQDTSQNTYTINHVKTADEGTYSCRPANLVGPGADATITLKVKGVHFDSYVYQRNR